MQSGSPRFSCWSPSVVTLIAFALEVQGWLGHSIRLFVASNTCSAAVRDRGAPLVLVGDRGRSADNRVPLASRWPAVGHSRSSSQPVEGVRDASQRCRRRRGRALLHRPTHLGVVGVVACVSGKWGESAPWGPSRAREGLATRAVIVAAAPCGRCQRRRGPKDQPSSREGWTAGRTGRPFPGILRRDRTLEPDSVSSCGRRASDSPSPGVDERINEGGMRCSTQVMQQRPGTCSKNN